MKTSSLLLVLTTCLAASGTHAQFPNFPAADKVLGASDFTTVGTMAATPSGMVNPTGLAIDQTTGKLFVAVLGQHRILRYADASSLANGANAEAVFGQVNFSGKSSGATATTLNLPYGLHVDGSGRLWVADFWNNRVLMFQGASTLPGFGSTPDLVLGQPDFTTVTAATSATTMSGPTGVFVDAAEHLWVADFNNHRVLKFANVSSLANGAAATTVLGQPNFTTGISGGGAATMQNPMSVTVDGAGRLWVAEQFNYRVLRFDNAATLANGAAAVGVLGHPDFISGGSGTTAQLFQGPSALALDAAGTLYVADYPNARVLFFKNAASKANGAAADGVIGQPDFVTNTGGRTERKLRGPNGGLVFDGTGALWVSDLANHRVLRFPTDRLAAVPRVTGSLPKSTTLAKLGLKGTASDDSGVSQVRFRVGSGPFKVALGTTSWKFTARLRPGMNTIEIVMVDIVGNVSPAKRLRLRRL